MEELSKDNKQVQLLSGAETKEFESERTQELHKKLQGGPHLGDAEKRNSEGTVAELQTNPETGNQRIEELIVEKDRLKMHYEELSKRIRELRETYVQEMNQQKREIELLQGKLVEKDRKLQEKHSELTKEKEEQGLIIEKNRELQEKHSELTEENEEQELIIEALQGEIASLMDEKSLLSQRLNATSEISRDISENCLQKYSLVLELERQALDRHEDVAAAMLAYAEGTVQQNKMRKDMDKLLDDSQQIQREKEAWMQDRSKIFNFLEELFIREFYTKESASKEEHKIETSDIQSRNSAMAKESRSQLAGTVKHMDVHPKAISRTVNEKPKSNVVSEKPKTKVAQENKKPAAKNAIIGKGRQFSTRGRL